MAAQFGTDGLRGVANADLTADVSLALGRAAARVLSPRALLVGRDTRRSGPMLQAAFSAGLATEGVDVVDVGVLPTPGLAYLSERRGLPAAVVSASHNPFGDNGIKLLAEGAKLARGVEEAIERELELLIATPGHGPARPTGEGVGRMSVDATARDDYERYLIDALSGRRLDGVRLVVDCANGAASAVAPEVFRALGATVSTVGCEPDGSNINDACGSTAPGRLAEAVVRNGADLGLAFDGDADRAVAVDHTGRVIDGDVLLALFAVDLATRGALVGDTVVVTVMTNLGFRSAMAERAIAVRETPVGDRHVLAALESESLVLGGEQSGHIVFRDRARTGDGVLTGLLLLDLLARHDRSMADLSAGLFEPFPQVQLNVAVPEPTRLAEADEVWQVVAKMEAELGEDGRVLLRPSGTEDVVRIMVEAASEHQARDVANRLRVVVENALGPSAP